MVYPALFETHLMDKVYSLGTFQWGLDNQHGAQRLWHDYLVSRVSRETDPTVCRYFEMRQNAKAFSQQTRIDLPEVIEALCRLALNHSRDEVGQPSEQGSWGPTKPREGKQQINMLSLAAYLGFSDLTKQLTDGHLPTAHNFLCVPPIQIAAQTSNTQMLLLHQEVLLKSQNAV
jgi:hypothetical protein